MKKSTKLLSCFIACFFLFCGCSDSQSLLGPKREVSSSETRTLKADMPVSLDLSDDSGNVEFFVWNKSEVAFEITRRLRYTKDQDSLEKKLAKDFRISLTQEAGTISFKADYRGSIKNPIDRSVDVTVHIPKKMKNIRCNLGLGKLKFQDEIRCDLDLKVEMVNTDISIFEGKLKMEGDMGNLNVNQGRLLGESSVSINHGNISIHADFQRNGSYMFKTGVGNIDLMIPKDAQISFENQGIVKENAFSAGNYPTKIKSSSGMGRIAIQMYG